MYEHVPFFSFLLHNSFHIPQRGGVLIHIVIGICIFNNSCHEIPTYSCTIIISFVFFFLLFVSNRIYHGGSKDRIAYRSRLGDYGHSLFWRYHRNKRLLFHFGVNQFLTPPHTCGDLTSGQLLAASYAEPYPASVGWNRGPTLENRCASGQLFPYGFWQTSRRSSFDLSMLLRRPSFTRHGFIQNATSHYDELFLHCSLSVSLRVVWIIGLFLYFRPVCMTSGMSGFLKVLCISVFSICGNSAGGGFWRTPIFAPTERSPKTNNMTKTLNDFRGPTQH